MKKLNKFLLILISVISLSIFSGCEFLDIVEQILVELESEENTTDTGTDDMEVHFIDVGQADSTLIKSASGVILIDGGDSATENELCQYIKNQGVKKIDVLIATHPHSDHIGGLDKVIESFDIGKIFMTNATHTSASYEKLLKSIKAKKITPKLTKAGENFNMGDVRLDFFNPSKDSYDNLNNYSIVTKMTYKNVAFLFAGDAESPVETDMLNAGYDLSADVYKVSHHGSSTSSSKKFMDAVSPKIGIISCGKDNDYGHPHRETQAILTAKKVSVFRTDEMGTVVLKTDGTGVYLGDKPEDLLKSEAIKDDKLDIEYVGANGVGLIKGNINRKGNKIYHMPGGSYYEQTNAEEYFKTEREAIENGFIKAPN